MEQLGRKKLKSPVLVSWRYSFVLRAYLHGGGGPQIGEVTRLGGVKY